MTTRSMLSILGTLLVACGGSGSRLTAPTPPSEADAEVREAAATEEEAGASSEEAAATAEEVVPFAAGEAVLAERGLDGIFLFRRAGETGLRAAFPALLDEPFIPASTFKIANTLIGLETGVIPDEHFTLPWDDVRRDREAWNRDHDLASAMAESVVWYYQEVARRIGVERMTDWLHRLEYGNMALGERVDSFWLQGPLAITPRQQLDFLERLSSGRLPVSTRSVGILEGVMPTRELAAGTVRAKTGTYADETSAHSWLVGWVEQGGTVAAHFVLLLRGSPADVPGIELRWELAGRLLVE